MYYSYATMAPAASKSTCMVNPVSVNRSRINSCEDIECGEHTPLLIGFKVRHPSCQTVGTSVNMGILALGVLLLGGITIGSYLLIMEDREWPVSHPFALVERETWGVQRAPAGDPLNHSAVNKVIILHTRGKTCSNTTSCIEIMNEMQVDSIVNYNKEIPYNFLIGGDGLTYEGRGWKVQNGFDDLPTKDTSLVIGFIGNFTEEDPKVQQMDEMKAFITESIRRFKLSPAYTLIGICNTAISDNDGAALYSNLINTENRFDLLKI